VRDLDGDGIPRPRLLPDARTAIVRAEIHDGAGKLAAAGKGTLRFVSQRAVERIGGFSVG
jgi:hypothetical protein